MNYPLRNILKAASIDDLVYEMPDIYTGIKIALHANAISNSSDICHDFSAYDREVGICEADLAGFFMSIPDEIWIEMVWATEDIPFFGRLPGSHVIIGSALSVYRSGTVNNLDMFLFVAAVDASVDNNIVTVGCLHSLSVSPLQLKFSQQSVSDFSLFGYRKIRKITRRSLESQLLTRDFILHRSALNFAIQTHHG